MPSLVRSGFAALCSLAFALPAAAQLPVTPRALGMGTSYLTLARGHDALFLNPGNLALTENPRWSVLLPGMTFGGTTVGPRFEDFYDIATAEDGEHDATQRFLASIPAGGMQFSLTARPALAVQVGRYALGISYGGVLNQNVGRDFAELAIDGFEPGRTDYTVGNTSGSRVTHLDVALAHARAMGPLKVGVTGHLIRGGEVGRSRLYEPRYGPQDQTIEIDFAEVLARGGTGFSLDAGVATAPIPGLTLGASVTNLVGTMSWSRDLRARHVTVTNEDLGSDDGSVQDDFEDIGRRFADSERPYSEVAGEARFVALADELHGFGDLSRSLQLGASYALSTYTRVAVAYRANLSTGSIAPSGYEGISVGVQQRLLILTARAGYTSNMGDRTLISGGITLGPLDLGVGRISGTEGGHDHTGWVGTLGLRVSGRVQR